METCYNCANITLGDDKYSLTTISTLISKAEEGCPGCKFSFDALGGWETIDAYGDAEAFLRRVSDEDNRVLLWLRRDDEVLEKILLRLCSSYGM